MSTQLTVYAGTILIVIILLIAFALMLFIVYRRLKEVFRQRSAELNEITQRLEAETGKRFVVDRELEVQRAFFEQMFLQSAVATQIFDRDGRRLRANSEWCRLFEVDEDDLPTLPYNIFEDPTIVGSGLVPALHRVLDDGITAEWEVLVPNGTALDTTQWLRIKAHPIWDSSHRVSHLVVHYEDISEIKGSQEGMQKSLREKDLLLKEVHHRVKNNMQLMKSMLHLQAGYVSDAHTLSMLTDSASRINAMALIHEKLYQSEEFGSIDIKSYLGYVAGSILQSYAVPVLQVELHTEIEPVILDIDTAIPCGLLANELLSNSMKHAFVGRSSGTITLTFQKVDQVEAEQPVRSSYRLCVADDGIGLPTRSGRNQNDSLGLKLVDSLVRQLGGNMNVTSDSGAGTRSTIEFAHPQETQPSSRGVQQ